MIHRPKIQILCALALILGGISCGPREESRTKAASSSPGTPGAPADQEADLFDPPRVLTFTIGIAAGELEAMQRGSHKYGRCTFTEGGRSLTDVGIRYKGNPTKEATSGKPDFNVEFNEFVSGQKFHGLKRVILLAARNDPSYLSAPIGLELFQQAGIPAARCGFARVELNGKDLGLYLLVEGVNRDFIERHFAKSKGNLYDEADDTDVDGTLEKYGGKDNPGQPDVDALAAATRVSDPAQRWEQLNRLLDMDRFLTSTALEVLLWLDDSYAITSKKFRIYHDPTTDRMVFFPKNVEEILDKTDGPLMPPWRGLVARAVLTTSQGQERYRETVSKLLASEFKPDKLQARARELATIMRPAAVGTDPERARKFDAAVAQFCDAIARRASFVAEELKAPPAAKATASAAPASSLGREE